MISSEVQRTLVKSPPELWAELSDPEALARHLGELGDIRIVRTEPECAVEWAAEAASGTVLIKPSGWGTNVRLTVTRNLATSERAPEPPAEPADARVGAETETETARLAAGVDSRPDPEPSAPSEPPSARAEHPDTLAEPRCSAPEPVPRVGFFAWLFRRRRTSQQDRTAADGVARGEAKADAAEPDAFAAVRELLAPETFAASHPFAALAPAPPEPPTRPEPSLPAQRTPPTEEVQSTAEQAADISAELMTAEEAAAEEVTAVLTAVLDRLGAAHHRPFSRA